MSSDEQPPAGRRSFSKGRLEAFSDGVFAIAITLLILDLTIHPPGSPLHQLYREWPSYVAYVISFLTIGAAWLGHTALTDRLERADAVLLRLNLLLLLMVTFLPFPTRLVGDALREADSERVYITLYGLTLIAIRLMGSALDAYAAREHLYTSDASPSSRREGRKLLPVLVGYVLAIVIGLVLPVAAVALYFALAVYLVVPFGEVARLFRRA